VALALTVPFLSAPTWATAFIVPSEHVTRAPNPGSIEFTAYQFGSYPVDGELPYSQLVADSSGDLYGTTSQGGLYTYGTVFELVPSGSSYTEKILYNFTGEGDGGEPTTGLVADAAGDLYGLTSTGGTDYNGTVFKLTPGQNGAFTFATIYSFSYTDGSSTNGPLLVDGSGNLYGTAQYGGAGSCACGVAYELSPQKNGPYSELILYSFQGGLDGSYPSAPLFAGSGGILYGTTYRGGANSSGVIFSLTPEKNGQYQESILHTFGGSGDGRYPETPVVQDSTGELYGAASDEVYSLTAAGSGYAIIFTFGNKRHDSANPSGFILGNNGALIGTAYSGGSKGDGTVFELTPTNGKYSEQILHSFAGSDGENPSSPVIEVKGALYGTTIYGGATHGLCSRGCGTAFKLTL
jgi:uncharacterized repeat protein (TIGR03803 family)